MLKSKSISSADSTFYYLILYLSLFNYIWFSNEYIGYVLLVAVRIDGYFFIDRFIRSFTCIRIILILYVYLTIACVWKLEIKVLLYLPVSQPPTVTMVLVSIKTKF